ncbi:hypothetical protein SLA2020_267750 [Shorea laevis]
MIEPIDSVSEMGQINMSSPRCACSSLDIRSGLDKRRESRVKDKAPTVLWVLAVAAIDGLQTTNGLLLSLQFGLSLVA